MREEGQDTEGAVEASHEEARGGRTQRGEPPGGAKE